MRWVLGAVLVLGLAACQVSLPGGRKAAPADPAPNVITGGAIEVTSLDAPAPPADAAPAKAPAKSSAKPLADPSAKTAPPDPAKAQPATPDPATPESGKPAADAATAPQPVAEPEAPPPPPKTPQQIACEKKGGQWAVAGKSGARTCVTPTGEGGKQCTRQTDCKGLCLARSGTCAPFTPVFGCNDILQADGSRTTLCLD